MLSCQFATAHRFSNCRDTLRSHVFHSQTCTWSQMRAVSCAFVHVQLINLRDFRPATFAEVTAIHSERYVNMLEEVSMLHAADGADASMDRPMRWRGCRTRAMPRCISRCQCLTHHAAICCRSCSAGRQRLSTLTPTSHPAPSMMPSRHSRAPLNPCDTTGLLALLCRDVADGCPGSCWQASGAAISVVDAVIDASAARLPGGSSTSGFGICRPPGHHAVVRARPDWSTEQPLHSCKQSVQR